MLYGLARFLQFAGLVLLPIALAGQMADRVSLKEMYFLAGSGVAVFTVGWLLQQTVKPR